MLPSDTFKLLKSKIGELSFIIFFTTFFGGLCIHFFRLSRSLLIWDSVFNFYDPQNTIHLGRWFLTIACGISSYYDLQWVNGLLSIIYISVVATIVCKLLKITSILPGILVSMLFISFPTVASTFSYMYTADGYFFGLLLMTIGLYITTTTHRGWIWGSILLAFGLGCYQAYLGFIITLILIIALQRLIIEDFNPSTFFLWIKDVFLFGIVGLALYYIINKFLLYVEGISLADYNGMSEMGFSFTNIPLAILSSYIDFTYFFFGPLSNIGLYQVLNLLLLALTCALFCASVILLYKNNNRYKVQITFLCIGCLFLFPLGCGIIYFISPQVRYYMLMNESFLCIYILPILFWDKFAKRKNIVQWSCMCVSLLISFNFAITSNIAYQKLEATNQATYFMLNRLVDRIEQLPEYDNLKNICIVGHIPDYDKIESAVPPYFSGVRDSYFIDNEKHFSAILADRFGISLSTHDNEIHTQFESSQKVLSMGIWPAKDSIIVDGDTVIVKMGD